LPLGVTFPPVSRASRRKAGLVARRFVLAHDPEKLQTFDEIMRKIKEKRMIPKRCRLFGQEHA
jgi:hypothetical protein